MITDKERGLYSKYRVERRDGKPIKGAAVVLESEDPNCKPAIEKFAETVEKDGYHELARDLRILAEDSPHDG